MKSHNDFIVCESGVYGSVVTRSFAESPDVSVLPLEAGGTDEVPNVRRAPTSGRAKVVAGTRQRPQSPQRQS
jgi:choline dehydrogenase-like flavoprotein